MKMHRLILFSGIAILFQLADLNHAELTYKSIGCWKDNIPRALELLEGEKSLVGHYKTRKSPVKACSEAAHRKGFQFFAVQDGGQCFGSRFNSTYAKYGKSTKCTAKTGGPMANDVYELDPCSEMSLSSTGPSGPAQNGFFNKHVFGNYRISETDADENAVYQKVEPFKDSTQHLFIHKNIKLHTGTWLIHQDKESTRGYLSTAECTDAHSLDQCNGKWKYFENGWHPDNEIKFVCRY